MELELIRGDTRYLDIDLEGYKMQDGDSLTLLINNLLQEKINVLKKTSNNTEFKLEPKDTQNLQKGLYSYKVVLTTWDGDVYTVVGPEELRMR